MSEEQQQDVPAPEVIGPGAMLKQAREKLNLSSADIAQKLHLKVVNIETIESDNYDENISVTFTKGYLKLYAKQVGVDESDVLAAFEKQNTKTKEPAKLQSFSRRVARQANDDRLMLVTYLVVAVVIALVVIWWFQQSDNESVSSLLPSSTPEVVTDVVEADDDIAQPLPQNVTAQPAVNVAERPQQNTAQENPEVSTAQATESQQAAAIENQPLETVESGNINTAPQAEVAETPEQTADSDVGGADLSPQATETQQLNTDLADPVELVFEFSGDCWMNLVDATGEAIAYGVKASGRIMPVTGVPPFEVTLGAPESVQISMAGESVDMTRFPAGRTARFSLPLAD